MHRVNAEVKRTQNKPKRFKQPYFNATATHEQTLSLLTCEEKTRVNWGTGKASQHVNASIRHMHREHSAYSNPTCALRAPFASHTFHSCVDLCRARERNTLKVLSWVVDGAGGLGAGKTSGAGTRGVDLNAAIGGRTGDSDTNGGKSSNN